MHHDERQSRTVTAPASPFLHGTMGRSHGRDHHPDACVRGTGHKEDNHGESLHFPSAVCFLLLLCLCTVYSYCNFSCINRLISTARVAHYGGLLL